VEWAPWIGQNCFYLILNHVMSIFFLLIISVLIAIYSIQLTAILTSDMSVFSLSVSTIILKLIIL
jgi:hypothetical protein